MSTKPKLPVRRRAPEPPDAPGAARPDIPVYRVANSDRGTSRIDVAITPQARADMEASKRSLSIASDRELLRHALSLQKWAVDVIRGGKRVFVTDAEGRIEAEMQVEPVHRPAHAEVIFDLPVRGGRDEE